MGLYGANAEDVQNALHRRDVEAWIEGGFSRKDFMEGAKRYLDDLVAQGMELPDE